MTTQRVREATIVQVPRAGHRLHVESTPGEGTPIVLMHGFPDNLHLYDDLLPHLAPRPVVRFDFLGWGRSDKPAGYPYTADSQTADLAAVLDHLDLRSVVLVAHDASGPPAIDWALTHPHRVAALVLLNTYYHAVPGLRRPPVIALFSTPVVRTVSRALARRSLTVTRRLFSWQVARFMINPDRRAAVVPALYEQFLPARPAFWRLNEDLLGTIWCRRRRRPELRRFPRPVRVAFGAQDRWLNPRVARAMASQFPDVELRLIPGAGHYVQIDAPERTAEVILPLG
jgi:haloalkane dehalogenase